MRALTALIAIAVVIAVAACGSSGSTTTTGSAHPQTLASRPYGFRVTLTPNWEEQDAQVNWNGKGLPDLSDPAWADFTGTVTGNELSVVSAPTGMGLAGFKAAMQAAELSSPALRTSAQRPRRPRRRQSAASRRWSGRQHAPPATTSIVPPSCTESTATSSCWPPIREATPPRTAASSSRSASPSVSRARTGELIDTQQSHPGRAL